MGEIPHSEKMFHLPIEVSVYVPSTQDVDKVVSKSEMKLRVEEVKKYLATLFGGFSSSSVEGGFLASDGKVVKENVERVVSFAEKSEFDKNKEALVQKASEWAAKWGQEAIGLEHEGDLYYVPQKFENGGTIAIREAKEMANSQAIELKHHISELANILKKKPTIEAWVIAKLESASKDLSDVTHYLDGRVQMSGKKMATGGNLPEKMIKVKVVYLEQQYFELTKEMEIPFEDYKEYDKTGKVPREIEDDLMSETTIDHWVETNSISVRLTPVIGTKYATGGNLGNRYQDNLEELLKEEGWVINYYDNNINDTSKDLATQVSLIKLDGLYSDSHWVKLPSKMQVTFDWLMNKVNTDKVYKSFAENFNKLLKSKGSKLNAYPTTYGIGVFVAMGSQSTIQKSKEEVENLLNSLGINYTTEYSDANWVYRYKISKSKENIEKIKNLEQKFGQGGQTQAQQNKIAKVMGEFKDRKLHSSSGDLVTDRKQAIAIALSEAGISKKMETGGRLNDNIPSTENFDNTRTSIAIYHEEKGNFMFPKNLVYLWLYEGEGASEKLESAEYDYVLYPISSLNMSFQKGFVPPLKRIWTKKFQDKHKGSQKLLGAIKAHLSEDGKELYIDMMSVSPTKKKKGIMSYMIKHLRDTYNLTQDQITFSDLTKEGESFVNKKKYADGGSIDTNSMEVQFIKYKDEEIMYEPHFKEYYVNDSMFHSLEEAKQFIDGGAPMSPEIKEAYRKGLFKDGGNMEFERPSYQSNYVEGQAQANEIADENWNMDYENDPLIKAQKKAKETATRIGMAVATRGASEVSKKASEGGAEMSGTNQMDMASMFKGMKG